jgi:hypothetical protein
MLQSNGGNKIISVQLIANLPLIANAKPSTVCGETILILQCGSPN